MQIYFMLFQNFLESVVAQCISAIDIGYRHFDTAWHYNTEEGLGIAITNKIADGTIKREDLFVTTKVVSVILYLYFFF